MDSEQDTTIQQKKNLIKKIERLSREDQELIFLFLYNQLKKSGHATKINYDTINQRALIDLNSLPDQVFQQLLDHMNHLDDRLNNLAPFCHQQNTQSTRPTPIKVDVRGKIDKK